jgi:ABC-type bacteriocin/lantibiotic exporter with double-glycine peptidase domain
MEKYLKNKINIKNMNPKFLKAKPFQETLNNGYCGPASLKIVLDYYGINKTEKEIAKMAGWNKTLGIDDKEIKKAAEMLGFRVKVKNNSNYRNIQNWLDKGVPVIVDWFTRGRSDYSDSAVPDGHYSVVVGLDDKFIYLQDPEIGKIRKLKKEDFITVWFDFSGKYIKPSGLIIRQIIAIYK